MHAQNLQIEEIIAQLKSYTFIDVRSETEFSKGHLPGAINVPLLDNEARIEIGTLYKQKGRTEAVRKGLELVGPIMPQLFDRYQELSLLGNPLVFYCWRGGLRSLISATLFQWSGNPVTRLHGGYKSYRKWVLDQFEIKYPLLIVGGATGSGKTEMLHRLAEKGEQIIDLEGLAHHKGSAFGSLGQLPQPCTETFENELAMQLFACQKDQTIWIENESRLIGTCFLPEPFWNQMQQAPILRVEVPQSVRASRLLIEYGHFERDLLIEKTEILRKKLGGQHANYAVEMLKEGNMMAWMETVLVYYDKTYGYSSEKNAYRSETIEFDWNKAEIEIKKLIEHHEFRK
jgi:tRNA 2-selenouridine synthase